MSRVLGWVLVGLVVYMVTVKWPAWVARGARVGITPGVIMNR